jgi:hypothetical protein
VDVTETALICGVMGGCDGLDVILSNRCGLGGGFVMFEAPSARVCEDSRLRFGASLIFGCV